MRGSAASEVIVGGGQIAVTVLGAPVLRRWYRRWGATEAEARRALPGDDLIPDPDLTSTRAVDVAAPPEAVWPWLIQIGHARGGMYSFDALENLVGCDLHSADEILPDHQHLEVGDLVRAGPDGYPAWCVVRCDPPSTLVLAAIAPGGDEAAVPGDHEDTRSIWQWSLTSSADGRGTRLISRTRTSFPRSTSVLWHLLEPVTFVMERRMLLGLRDRAERAAAG